jgi:signal transduction histidine kinase
MSAFRAFFASMAGRIFVALLIGVVTSSSLALAFAGWNRQRDFDRLQLARVVEVAEDFLPRANAASPAERRKLFAEGVPGLRPAPASAPRGRVDPLLTEMLRARLGVEAEAEEVPADSCAQTARNARCWVIRLPLDDGAVWSRWHTSPFRRLNWYEFDLLFLFVLLVGVGGVTLIVARMAAAPLARLSEAAAGLDLDLDRPAIKEDGPREVRDAARSFNAMQRRLKQHLEQRTQILAAITHDLRTPLTRMQLRLERLPEGATRERLLTDLQAMQMLVREGLDLAQSHETRELLATVDLKSLLESLAEDARDAGHHIDTTAILTCDVRVRPQGFRRCVSNLIDNAVAYAGSAEIAMEIHREFVTIAIRDRGPGIPKDKLELVFEPYQRLDASRSRQTGGVGLGLTIARSLAAQSGASVQLENRAGGGLEAKIVVRTAVRPTRQAPGGLTPPT